MNIMFIFFMPSIVDKILEVFPTSRDIARCLPSPSIPQCSVKISPRLLFNCFSREFNKGINTGLRRILKNPPKAIAILFLVSLGTLFVLGHKPSFSRSPANHVRGSWSDDFGYKVDINGDKAKPLSQHAPLVTLPKQFNYLTMNNATLRAAPVFWSLPRSGGSTIRDIMGKCRGMVIAGSWVGSTSDMEIVFENGMKQVTADFSTKENRLAARDRGLKDVDSNLLIVTQNVLEASEIFPGSHQAELWTWFRHPVDRQISYYFWLRSLSPGHPQYDLSTQRMSLTEWVQTRSHIPNAMMSSLLGVPTNPMGWTEIDLTIAKNLLRQKAMIGLLEQKTESLRRFLVLHRVGASGARECQERMLDYAWPNNGHHDTVGKKSDAYQLLIQSNSLDMKLYEYAKFLFDLQSEFFIAH